MAIPARDRLGHPGRRRLPERRWKDVLDPPAGNHWQRGTVNAGSRVATEHPQRGRQVRMEEGSAGGTPRWKGRGQPDGGKGSLPGGTVSVLRIEPSVPWMISSPPPSLRRMSRARSMASC